MTTAALALPVQRRADERLLWVCVVASMLLHALLMYRMHGVEPAAPMVQEFKATIRTQAPPTARPAPEPPKPEPTPEPPKPLAPPQPVAPPKPVVPPVTPAIAPKATPVERKAAPVAPAPAAPAPAAPPPADAKNDAKSAAPAAPPATAPVAPSPGTSSSSDSDLRPLVESYAQLLANAAEKYKRYPSEAMNQNWEGVARIRVRVGANGMISSVDVVSSSGHDLLDEQAKITANKAKPYVQIPAGLRGQPFDVYINVVFSLKK